MNISSLRNKFNMPTNKVIKYIAVLTILMISETKHDDTFLHASFI